MHAYELLYRQYSSICHDWSAWLIIVGFFVHKMKNRWYTTIIFFCASSIFVPTVILTVSLPERSICKQRNLGSKLSCEKKPSSKIYVFRYSKCLATLNNFHSFEFRKTYTPNQCFNSLLEYFVADSKWRRLERNYKTQGLTPSLNTLWRIIVKEAGKELQDHNLGDTKKLVL